ncbi:DUF3099 domain-containing protein [Sinomonas mesophila]|uniref:DUF3099 domain-containing protein n=1 Tax=Sinomonas mesophila TaxID=1531955 RepID=UPI00098599AC|nr:DUF3099 domain-containing protein [Sinomonas mesophila]
MTRDPAGRTGHDASGEAAEVHSITAAAPGHSIDMHQRMVRYAVAMGIRMVCIVLIFVLDGWFKLIAVAGAVFLPWVAVVIANAQVQAETYDGDMLDAAPLAEIGPAAPHEADAETIQGEVVENEAEAEYQRPGDTAPEDARPSEPDHDETDTREKEAGAA